MPHVIRLRGPWSWELLSAEQQTLASGQLDLAQGVSGLPAGVGCWRLSRRFGRPTLPPGERVWLVVESARPLQRVALNDLPLSADTAASVRMDVTELLASRNELVIHLDAESPGGDRVDARLELGE
jgi:hypothetical protein